MGSRPDRGRVTPHRQPWSRAESPQGRRCPSRLAGYGSVSSRPGPIRPESGVRAGRSFRVGAATCRPAPPPRSSWAPSSLPCSSASRRARGRGRSSRRPTGRPTRSSAQERTKRIGHPPQPRRRMVATASPDEAARRAHPDPGHRCCAAGHRPSTTSGRSDRQGPGQGRRRNRLARPLPRAHPRPRARQELRARDPGRGPLPRHRARCHRRRQRARCHRPRHRPRRPWPHLRRHRRRRLLLPRSNPATARHPGRVRGGPAVDHRRGLRAAAGDDAPHARLRNAARR
jgi:hypothetical protein